jgi:hypothetical protein
MGIEWWADIEPDGKPFCHHCNREFSEADYLALIEPEAVMGEHVIAVELYQCGACEKFTVYAYDTI